MDRSVAKKLQLTANSGLLAKDYNQEGVVLPLEYKTHTAAEGISNGLLRMPYGFRHAGH